MDKPMRLTYFLILLVAWCAQSRGSTQDPLEHEPKMEIDRFVEADRRSPPALCQVLFVGSSSFVKWKDTLKADMAPIPVINRGFGGSHIQYVNRWFDLIVAPYKPRAIVFYAGENDIDAGNPPDKVIADFDEFMALKTKALGNTPVFFISVKPSKLRFSELSLQAQVNGAIRTRAEKRHDLRYLDVVPAMLEGGKPKDIFRPDGLHMNEQGYAIWTRIIRGALLPIIETERRVCEEK